MATQVASGLYRFFTSADVDAEKAKFIAAVKQNTASRSASGGGLIHTGMINGQNVGFIFPAGISSFEEWGAVIQDAYNQLANTDSTVDVSVATDRAVVRFQVCPIF